MTKDQLNALIREVLQEVTSEKQRRYMCALMNKPADERPEGLSQAEAEEMCKSEVEESMAMADPGVVGTTKKKKNAVCPPGTQWKEESGGFGNCVKLDEKKKGKDDRCTRIAKRKYDVWPSAYASGAVVRCRAGKIWKGVKEAAGDEEDLERKIRRALRDEGGAAGMGALVKHTDASEADIKGAIKEMDDVGRHEDGDYILDDGDTVDILDEDLRKWFKRKGAPGKKGGWVDCNAPKYKKGKKIGYKPCGRQKGEKRSKYPACRPTAAACKSKGKGKKWGKKSKKRTNEMITKEMITNMVYEYAIFPHLDEAFLEEGGPVCIGCLGEQLYEASCDCPHLVYEAEYRGRKVKLNKPMRGDVKKFKVYVKDPKTGNVKKVNFGHGGTSAKKKGEKTMKIRKNNPKARKSFRARHNCKNPGPKTKARYWSCKKW